VFQILAINMHIYGFELRTPPVNGMHQKSYNKSIEQKHLLVYHSKTKTKDHRESRLGKTPHKF